MVTLEQIKQGAARYVDEEFTGKLTGWQKWAVGAGAAMALGNLDASLSTLREHPAVKALGVFDEAGNVDIDKIYACLKTEAAKGPVTTNIPLIGNVTLNETDVDKLYTLIKQS